MPPAAALRIVEPFAGKGDLIEWVRTKAIQLPIDAYDIDPKRSDIQKRDTLREPPSYKDAWVITNPPYLARNKSNEKSIYDMYSTNDLYKCFMLSLTQSECVGGIVLIPAGFFFSPRSIDTHCRSSFMSMFRIRAVKYFEETVFADTSTTIVAVSFERATETLQEQTIPWTRLPSREQMNFHMEASSGWIVGGEIYALPIPSSITVRRHVEGQPLREKEHQTFMTLNALDSGTANGMIKLTYQKDYVYPAKECSRTYATFRIEGHVLTEEQQQDLCNQFNKFLTEKRTATWSLFLPQYRESKEYARKRIPFELAYRIVLHLIWRQQTQSTESTPTDRQHIHAT
jgi:hypothetical protein